MKKFSVVLRNMKFKPKTNSIEGGAAVLKIKLVSAAML